RTTCYGFLEELGKALAKFDWRASSEPSLSDDEKMIRSGFRGSGGYRNLREHLLRHLAGFGDEIGKSAKQTIKRLGYD
ncbi:MAG: hypothetical protein ABSA47_12710, partial [Verrucomicrobiota bacterium]